jgi:hypothetical protein
VQSGASARLARPLVREVARSLALAILLAVMRTLAIATLLAAPTLAFADRGGTPTASQGSADRALDARVIWSGDGRVYLASGDSISLESGARLTFLEHGKSVSEARVGRVLDGHLISALVTWQRADAFRKPERLEVRLAAPVLAAAPSLRVGIPDGVRGSQLAGCASGAPSSPLAELGYRIDALADPSPERALRLVRASGDSAANAPLASWPDTLRVFRFAESTDEEIALERGELDVGVFWPGELSSAIREQPLGQQLLFGIRARGGLAVADEAPAPSPGVPSAASVSVAAMEALNRELFRGDLLLSAVADSGAGTPIRFRVEASVRGHAEIERVLNAHSASTTSRARLVRVFEADSIQEGASATASAAWVLRVRCPLVCAPDLRAYVRALGTDRFAQLPGCSPRQAPR